MKSYILLVVTFICFNGFCQDDTTFSKEAMFFSKLKTVKYADLSLDKNAVKYFISRGANENADIVALSQYIKDDLKLNGALFTEEQRNLAYSDCKSMSDIVQLSWQIGAFESSLGAIGSYPCKIQFSFIDKSTYEFNCPINVSGYTFSLPKAILRSLRKNIVKPTNETPPDFIYNLPMGKIIKTESELDTYFNSDLPKGKLEGIYKMFTGNASMSKIAIVKIGEEYFVLHIENKYFNNDWQFGEIKGVLNPTLSSKMFTGTLKKVNKQDDIISLTITEDNVIEFQSESTKEKYTFIKIK